jgi:hypothetical protein
MSRGLPTRSLRGRAAIPSPACGGGRGPGAVPLAAATPDTQRALAPVEVRASGGFPLPNPPPQAGEGARGVMP